VLCKRFAPSPTSTYPPAGSWVVRIDPLCFLAGCHKRRLNQALTFSIVVLIALFLLGRIFGVLLVYVFCLLVVLVKLSVLAK